MGINEEHSEQICQVSLIVIAMIAMDESSNENSRRAAVETFWSFFVDRSAELLYVSVSRT